VHELTVLGTSDRAATIGVVLPSVRLVYDLVSDLVPGDQLEAAHRRETLRWLETTDDVYRRKAPLTPPQHLVAYVLLVDDGARSVLLVDHIKSGLWLPAGGHVEPGEHPIETVRRETKEELGIDAVFHPALGERPAFVTVTETVGEHRHTDVSLWFVLDGGEGQALVPDPREFRGVRWWSRVDLPAADLAGFEPHLGRMLARLDRLPRTR
jgi:8-oxo-dGTP diphosphatase